MYFIVFWKEWCATIPSCWLFKESKIFKWPPKSKNPTLESIKATLPKENWSTIHYNRFIGPFGVAKCFVDNENNNIGFESQPLEYGNFFSQEPLLTKQSEPTNNNVESNNEIYISETLNDLNDTNQLDEQISLQQNILTSCRRDIQTIKKTINSVYLLVLDMSNEAPRDATNNLALNLPITSEKELKDFEILLKEDAAARSQYKKMIKNIGGTTFQKHVRNALTATLTDQMAYKMSWTGQKNSLMVKEMKIMDLIIETIINSRLDSTIDKIQAVIKSWLQHADDRLPKEERINKK
ncbi:hypothetical protein EAG_00686 [Camponotus floridanus]|uniref:DUF4806 domain-containing protein n=1 Tax=Camponotus floridanus TaxID=104421 RepID=E2AY91_CAMFO|nr:hypothetical protein EAG_00686 [Camponotus floridanus]